MKKSEVNICDVCRRIVTKKKCEICDDDICEDCEDDMAIGLANGGILFYVISCKACSNKLEHSRLKKYFEDEPHTKIRKNMLKVFRNAIVVENMQDNDERKADRRWMLEKIKIDSGHPFKKKKKSSLGTWGTAEIPKTKAIGIGGAFTTNMKGGMFKTKK